VVLTVQFGAYFRVSGNYTHQRAVNKSNIPSQTGKILPGRPVHEFSGKTEVFLNKISLSYTYDFTAENYLDPANQIPTTSRSIHNIGLMVKPTKQVSAAFEVKNLTNDQIEDVFGFPLPGRSYFLTVQADF
jgi:iron complex outermembrane receptor protein